MAEQSSTITMRNDREALVDDHSHRHRRRRRHHCCFKRTSFYGGDARVHSLVWGTLLEEETLDRDHFTLQSAPRRG